MLKTVLQRLLQIIPTLLIVVSITFVLTRMIPGDPAAAMLGPQASLDEITKLRTEMGLNASLGQQYLNYLGDIVRGNFGHSYSYSE